MRKSEVESLKLGLYTIYWKSGGSSLASVGQLYDGARWLAPCNWITDNKDMDKKGKVNGIAFSGPVWRQVKTVKLLVSVGERDSPVQFDDLAIGDYFTMGFGGTIFRKTADGEYRNDANEHLYVGSEGLVYSIKKELYENFCKRN